MAAEHVSRMGERIREHRFNRGLTQDELARELGPKVTGAAVSRWERGQHRPSDDHLERLAQVLRVPVASFLADPPHRGKTPEIPGRNGTSPVTQLDRVEATIAELFERMELMAGGLREVRAALSRLEHGTMIPAVRHASDADLKRAEKFAKEADAIRAAEAAEAAAQETGQKRGASAGKQSAKAKKRATG